MTEHTPNDIPATPEGRRREIRRLKRLQRADRAALAITNRRMADLQRKRAAVMAEMRDLCPGAMKQ